MVIRNRLIGLAIALGFGASGIASAQERATPEQLEFFEKKVRPIFVEHCYNCHSQDHKEAGGLRVDDHRAILQGGNTGAAVVPHKIDQSLIIQRVTHVDDKKAMPPGSRLSEDQINYLKHWIEDGAAWPPLVVPSDVDQTLDGQHVHAELLTSHWAWQAMRSVDVPQVPSTDDLAKWARSDIDQFIAVKWLEHGLVPVRDSHRIELLRRVYYDLTGLPPTEDQLIEFLLDESANAFERVVDRLLQSDRYAERWARHWLDVARYGESTGSARNLPYPHAWRYRDYVIDSFRMDKPYNRFLQEQIAGDLLPASSVVEKKEQLIATGFLALGVKDVNQRFTVRYNMDNVDEQIDTVSKAVLGLTVSCARCHDHKFDPISTRDYYALAGIFSSTELCDGLRNQMGGSGLAYYVPSRLIALSEKPAGEIDEAKRSVIEEKKKVAEKLRAEFLSIRDNVKQEEKGPEHAEKLRKARQAMQKAQAEVVSLTDPAKSGPVAIGVRDAKKIEDTEIRIRGEAEKLGPVVPRGVPSILSHLPSGKIEPDQSGRYELAKWLTHPQNSLTTRVIVNRVWSKLFSRGLVKSVDNFGVTGDTPSHPELLDYLATEFVKDGWSIKKLIRKIVLSRAYQLASFNDPQLRSIDPENRWIWQHSRRRFDAEEIRDTILIVSEQLENGPPTDVPSHELPVIELPNNGKEAKQLLEFANRVKTRSLYLPWVRGLVTESLHTFDSVEQGMVTGSREITTVPTQALFMLNDPLVHDSSLRIAKLIRNTKKSSDAVVSKVYHQVLQRSPNPEELRLAEDFLKDYSKTLVESKSKERSGTTNSASSSTPEAVSPLATLANDAAPEDSRPAEAVMPSNRNETTDDEATEALAALVQALIASAEFRYVP
ncbi:MAG: PSD1 and planctomycete cytochrome C domain-containing protein [Pirellula sp.]